MSGPTLKPSDHTAALEILDAGGNRLKAPSTLNTLSMPKLTSCGIATLLAKVGSRLSRDTSERWGEKSWSFCGLVYCARAEEQIKSIAAPGRSINLSVSKLAAPEILIGVSNSWLAQPRRISGLPSRALLPPDFRNRALELKSAGARALSVNCGTRGHRGLDRQPVGVRAFYSLGNVAPQSLQAAVALMLDEVGAVD